MLIFNHITLNYVTKAGLLGVLYMFPLVADGFIYDLGLIADPSVNPATDLGLITEPSGTPLDLGVI